MLVCRGRAGFTISRNLGVARPKEIYHALSFCLIMSSRRDLVTSIKLFFKSLGFLFSSFVDFFIDHLGLILLILVLVLSIFCISVWTILHFSLRDGDYIYTPLPCREVLYCGGEVGGE